MRMILGVAALAAMIASGGALAQQKAEDKAEEPGPADRVGPLTEIKAEESDLKLEAPQFAGATATFYRQEIHGERALRDMAVYRSRTDIAYVRFDTVDPQVVGSFGSGQEPRVAVKALSNLLPKNAEFAWGQTREYTAAARSYPTEHFRMSFQGGAADCITFLRVYDPKPGRSLASKRLSGIYCSTAVALDEARVIAFFDGIRTRM